MKKTSDKEYKAIIKTLGKALSEAYDHLNYCGWGDAWERSCAKEDKLPEKILEALKLAGIKK